MDGDDDTVDSDTSSTDSVDASDTDSTPAESDAGEPADAGGDTDAQDSPPTDTDESGADETETSTQSQSTASNDAEEDADAETTDDETAASTDGETEKPTDDEDAESTDDEDAESTHDDSDGAVDDESEESETAPLTTGQKVKQQITKRRVAGSLVVLLALFVLVVVLLVPTSLLSLVYSPSAEFTAQSVGVDQGAVDEHGYEAMTSESFEVTEQVSPLGQSKSIITTNYRENYERTVAVQNEQFNSAIFTAVSTPAIEVAGSPQNPLAGMSHKQLLSEFSSDLEGGYEGLGNFTKVTEREAVLLGDETRVSQFETAVTVNNETVDVYLYVGTVRSGGDIVVAVGGHPAPFAQERVSLLELMAAVEHPVE